LPNSPEHRAKAEHNEFFCTDTGEPFWDWAITGAFYCALHYVESYLASLHPPTHKIRDSLIYREHNLKAIYDDYRELQEESRNARYDASLTFVQSDFVRVQKRLTSIKAVILPLLP
jgi:hypothetical protein